MLIYRLHIKDTRSTDSIVIIPRLLHLLYIHMHKYIDFIVRCTRAMIRGQCTGACIQMTQPCSYWQPDHQLFARFGICVCPLENYMQKPFPTNNRTTFVSVEHALLTRLFKGYHSSTSLPLFRFSFANINACSDGFNHTQLSNSAVCLNLFLLCLTHLVSTLPCTSRHISIHKW